MNNFLSSSMEEELGLYFSTDKDRNPFSYSSQKWVATGNIFVNYIIRQCRFRAINMIFYWVRDRVRQGQIIVYCIYV